MEKTTLVIQKPPLDPNPQKNRSPLLIELNTLRNLHAKNRLLAETIDTQLGAAKEEHQRIQTRYDAVKMEFESIQSELNASYRYISMLEEQDRSLLAESERIQVLLHPIRRCPEDILGLIFDWAVCSEQPFPISSFGTATSISHVCRLWPSVALGMGSLWSDIEFYLNENLDSICDYLTRTKLRVQSLPVEIHIRNIGPTSLGPSSSTFSALFLNLINLQRFKSVKLVELHFVGNIQALDIGLTVLQHLHSDPERLTLRICFPFGADKTWAYGRFLLHFPQLKHIELDHIEINNSHPPGLMSPYLGSNSQFPRIQNFSLSSALASPLDLLLFGGLKTLHLNFVTFDGDIWPERVEMHELQSIKIQEVDEFPWHKLFAPQLRSLSQQDDSREAIDFICRHRKLEHLDALFNEEDFRKVAAALPNLKSLETCELPIDALLPKKQIPNAQLFPFPHITKLTTWLPQEGLSLETFDAFIKNRYLDQQNFNLQNEKFTPLLSWDIVNSQSHEKGIPWQASQFIDHFDQTKVSKSVWRLHWLG